MAASTASALLSRPDLIASARATASSSPRASSQNACTCRIRVTLATMTPTYLIPDESAQQIKYRRVRLLRTPAVGRDASLPSQGNCRTRGSRGQHRKESGDLGPDL